MLNKDKVMGGISPILTVTMGMLPSDIGVTVYLIDGSTEDVDRQNMVKQYAISDVDYVEVIIPSPPAPGTAIGYNNLLQERISTRPKIYHYTVKDKTKDARLRTYYVE